MNCGASDRHSAAIANIISAYTIAVPAARATRQAVQRRRGGAGGMSISALIVSALSWCQRRPRAGAGRGEMSVGSPWQQRTRQPCHFRQWIEEQQPPVGDEREADRPAEQ